MKRVATFIFFLLIVPGLATAAELININTADAPLLETLPGIGPVKAQAVIDFRTASGTFALPSDIQNVTGIGPVTFANIEPLITVVGGISSLPKPAPKPLPAKDSSTIVQKVAVQKLVSQPAYENAPVVAPTEAAHTALVGAPVHSYTRLFTSPWAFGFVGLLAFSAVILVAL